MTSFYTNARLIDPASNLDATGSVIVQNGVIIDVGPKLSKPDGAEVVDCQGFCLSPGLIDLRAELGEPGQEHKETFATAAEAAAVGGVTSIACLPNAKPVVDDISLVQFIQRRAAEVGKVRVYPYASLTKGQEGQGLCEIGLLKQAGAIGFTDLPRSIGSAQLMRRALSYAKNYDALIMVHPEEPSLAQNGQMNAGELSTRLGLSGISPVAEVIMIERDLRLAQDVGAPFHIAHVSTRAGVDAIRRAKADGVKVTCDTAPPYFALNENEVAAYRTFAKFSPPLRSEDDRKAVIEGLKDGTIDAIASDHNPQDQDSKRLPFAQAEAGCIGLETLLPISLELYHNGYLTLLEVLRKLTITPATVLGLPQGRLSKGAPADFAVFDLNRAWKIDAEAMKSKAKNSPFDKKPTMGKVVMTVVGGRPVFAPPRNDMKQAA